MLDASNPTPPAKNPSQYDKTHMRHAILQAQIGLQEGGIPIGGALVKHSFTLFYSLFSPNIFKLG